MDEEGVENTVKEYEDELRDKLDILISHDSPNLSKSRLMRRSFQPIEACEADNENSEIKTLEDLPVLEIEGAPEGWSRGGRRRQTLAVPEVGLPERRGSLFPPNSGKENDRRKSSARNGRRASQMTFEEWCQLKKFQELHNAAINAQEQKAETGNRNLIKRNISYEEWCNASKERKKQQMKILEEYRKKEEEAKIAQEQAKFKRSLSFDKWISLKESAKAAAAKMKEANRGEERKEGSRRNSMEKGQNSELTPEERKKKSEEAHRRWLIKKEMEEIKKERDKLLKMQNAKVSITEAPNNSLKGQSRRRGSWMDTNAALQVAANRNRKDS